MQSIEQIINLERGERIELLVRRSLWAWFWPIFFACLFIILPFFAMFPLFMIGKWGVIIFFISVAIGLVIFLRIYISKRNTVFVVTNLRLADIWQKGFIGREAVEIPYEKIKSIKCERNNLFDFFQGLGNIYLLLSDNKSKILLSKIKNHQAAADKIFSCHRRYFKLKQH